jgi:hypothetical protein
MSGHAAPRLITLPDYFLVRPFSQLANDQFYRNPRREC